MANTSQLLRTVGITGTGSYAPERVLTNADLEKMVDTTDEWILSRTGIRERHIARPDETTSDMGAEAARRALAKAGVSGGAGGPDHRGHHYARHGLPQHGLFCAEQNRGGECLLLRSGSGLLGFPLCVGSGAPGRGFGQRGHRVGGGGGEDQLHHGLEGPLPVRVVW
jgi:hypothetical protein